MAEQLFHDNELVKKANDYIRRHKVNQLFEDLCTLVCFQQPQNLQKFLIQQLQQRKKEGSRSTIFTQSQIQNVYNLFDLKEEGNISKEQAVKALQTLANSQFHFTQAEEAKIPQKVDVFKFMRLCEQVLGIKAGQD